MTNLGEEDTERPKLDDENRRARTGDSLRDGPYNTTALAYPVLRVDRAYDLQKGIRNE